MGTQLLETKWLAALNLTLLVLVLLAFARGIYLQTDLIPKPLQIEQPLVQPSSTANRQQASISTFHIFGSKRIQQTNLSPAPATPLKLSLTGTLMAEAPSERRAFIADAKGNQNVYAVDDALPGQATVLEIQQDHVLISRAGKRETLALPESQIDVSPTQTSTSNLQALTAFRGGPLNQSPPIPGIRTGSVKPGSTVVNLQQAQSQLKLDPAALARQVSASPVRKNGQLVGYRLKAGRYASVLARAGIRPTDVITELNGQSLTQASAPLTLMNALQNGGNMQITLERNGQPLTVPLELEP